jgi:hypothetical protein
MRVLTLTSASTATGVGEDYTVLQHGGQGSFARGIVQALLTGTATVALQGSLDGTNWVSLVDYSGNGADEVGLMPYVRGNVTSFTSGAVTLKLAVPSELQVTAVA